MKRRAGDVGNFGEGLVDGLNHHERLAKIDATLDGDKYHAGLVERVQRLESAERRRAMPWWMRWMVTTGLRREKTT